MKQRVAIARTLINKPRLVLMDEPFGALDPQTRWGMQGLLLDVSRTEDNTILFVTHDVSEAVYLADTVYVLSARPARILHRVDVPFFAVRDIALKSSPEFRAVEKKLLDLLYTRSRPSRVEWSPWPRPRSPGRPTAARPEARRQAEAPADARGGCRRGMAKTAVRDAVLEKRPYLRFAFANPYNLSLFGGALAAAAVTVEPAAGAGGRRASRPSGCCTRRTRSGCDTCCGIRDSRSSGTRCRNRSARTG